MASLLLLRFRKGQPTTACFTQPKREVTTAAFLHVPVPEVSLAVPGLRRIIGLPKW